MKKRIPEITFFAFNNRADALQLANDAITDCVVAAIHIHGATHPVAWIVVDKNMKEAIKDQIAGK
jgi:hypothetical protein